MGDLLIVVQKGMRGVRGAGFRLQASGFRETVVGFRSSVVGSGRVGTGTLARPGRAQLGNSLPGLKPN